jgi:hypothetical protein
MHQALTLYQSYNIPPLVPGIILELLESLGCRLVLGHSEDVESDGLGQRSALTDSDLVTLVNSESGGAVGSEVLVTFLVSAVFGDANGLADVHKEY